MGGAGASGGVGTASAGVAGTSAGTAGQPSAGSDAGGTSSEGGSAGAPSDPNLLLDDDFETGGAEEGADCPGLVVAVL